jgi:RNA-splicing ligase RtcB
MKINGVEVKGGEELFDQTFKEQVSELAEHEAFNADEMTIMPDGHAGAGAVIGFTMPIQDKVVPNTVGVDIGCGVTAVNVGKPGCLEGEDESVYEMIDEEIREKVPLGRETHSNPDYHIVNDFPWETCQEKWEMFLERNEQFSYLVGSEPYGEEYFKDLCQRVGYDLNRAIASMGTLGGGNHFIEISQSDLSEDYWVVIHSGSRGIGLSIANYWQDKATEYTTSRKTRDDVPKHIEKYLGEDWKPLADKIRSDFGGEEIQAKFDEVSQAIEKYGPSSDNRNTDLDWLEGEEMVGYIQDMIFAQQYARENRKEMCKAVADVLDSEIIRTIDSIHNYIDFEDGIIRKGATPARDGQPLVVPFNMADGAILGIGVGKRSWNSSAPHGAGRRGSRRWAYDEFSVDEFEDSMEDVFSTSVNEDTLDEAPMAYKEAESVREEMKDTAKIMEYLNPVINIKAEQ